MGGISPRNLHDTFDWWSSVLQRAGEEFGNSSKPADTSTPDTNGKTL